MCVCCVNNLQLETSRRRSCLSQVFRTVKQTTIAGRTEIPGKKIQATLISYSAPLIHARVCPYISCERSSDDGEPSSTAGKPILSAIIGCDLQYTCCVVTRHFGGIKLGTGMHIRMHVVCVTLHLTQQLIICRHGWGDRRPGACLWLVGEGVHAKRANNDGDAVAEIDLAGFLGGCTCRLGHVYNWAVFNRVAVVWREGCRDHNFGVDAASRRADTKAEFSNTRAGNTSRDGAHDRFVAVAFVVISSHKERVRSKNLHLDSLLEGLGC